MCLHLAQALFLYDALHTEGNHPETARSHSSQPVTQQGTKWSDKQDSAKTRASTNRHHGDKQRQHTTATTKRRTGGRAEPEPHRQTTAGRQKGDGVDEVQGQRRAILLLPEKVQNQVLTPDSNLNEQPRTHRKARPDPFPLHGDRLLATHAAPTGRRRMGICGGIGEGSLCAYGPELARELGTYLHRLQHRARCQGEGRGGRDGKGEPSHDQRTTQNQGGRRHYVSPVGGRGGGKPTRSTQQAGSA